MITTLTHLAEAAAAQSPPADDRRVPHLATAVGSPPVALERRIQLGLTESRLNYADH
jgi:hypothetical protein